MKKIKFSELKAGQHFKVASLEKGFEEFIKLKGYALTCRPGIETGDEYMNAVNCLSGELVSIGLHKKVLIDK